MSCPYCEKIIKIIEEKYPTLPRESNEVCEMWNKLVKTIPINQKIINSIKEQHEVNCFCPNCGELFCDWCD